MKKFIYMAGALMLLFPVFSVAQVLPFVAAEYDAASLGTAGADLADSDNTAYAAFGNPAAMGFAESKLDAAAGLAMWAPTGGSVITAGASYGLGRISVAAGFISGTHQAYDVTSAGGTVTGTFAPTDMLVAAGLSYRLRQAFSLGINVGYASSALSDKHSYGAVKADLFAMAQKEGFRAALGLRNFGTAVASASGTKFSLPSSLALGAAYDMSFTEEHRVEVLLDADYYFNEGVAVAAGVEYAMKEFVFVRGGYRYGGESPVSSFASLGAGVKFAGVKLDVAYLLGSEIIGNTLSVGLGYTF